MIRLVEKRVKAEMSAYEELIKSLGETEAIRQVVTSLQKEPVAVLHAICKEYESTSQPVPDHHLRFSGYWKDVALRALMSAGLIARETGGRHSIYAYRPTSQGLDFYRRLAEEGWSPGK